MNSLEPVLSQLATLVPYVVLPISGALIGWITNFVAVRMLFRPQRPVKFLGFTWQGLVPKRQVELAQSIGETIERKLLSHDDIATVLTSPEVQGKIQSHLGGQIDDLLAQFANRNPMIGMFLQGEAGAQIKASLHRKLDESIPQLLTETMSALEEKLNFKEVIRKRIEQFDLSTLESLINTIASRELRTIEYLGGVLGFIVGLLQAAIIPFLS